MLEVREIDCYYGFIQVLKGVSLHVPGKKIVSIIGANGAGKSTLLRAISGLMPVAAGQIIFNGTDITGFSPQQIVRLGICHVLEGRQIFFELTTRDNLELGAYLWHNRKNQEQIKEGIDFVYALFPRLKERFRQIAGTLSGGEQQMLAIGRALLGRPKLLLLDEPSLGLAPMVVKEIFRVIAGLRDKGVTILTIEQRARLALELSEYGYVLELGKILMDGRATDLLDNEKVRQAYLGG